MGVYGFLLSVPAAMVLHGIAQAFSNGSRFWLYRRHIKWRVLTFYCIGALSVFSAFSFIQFVPHIGLVFILIGIFPFVALLLPKQINLNIERPSTSMSSGVTVTVAQMLAGASGPVLDIFYSKSTMSKEEVLGTKAVTQTVGHALKLFYYLNIMTISAKTIPVWVPPAVITAAIVGNYVGSFFVEKITDETFKRIGRYVITLIGIVYLTKGIEELI